MPKDGDLSFLLNFSTSTREEQELNRRTCPRTHAHSTLSSEEAHFRSKVGPMLHLATSPDVLSIVMDSSHSPPPVTSASSLPPPFHKILFVNWLQHPTNDNTCPICLDVFVAPVVTKCGHVFCHPCILRHFLSCTVTKVSSSASSASAAASSPTSTTRCPSCYYAGLSPSLSLGLKAVHFVSTHQVFRPGSVVRLRRFDPRGVVVPSGVGGGGGGGGRFLPADVGGLPASASSPLPPTSESFYADLLRSFVAKLTESLRGVPKEDRQAAEVVRECIELLEGEGRARAAAEAARPPAPPPPPPPLSRTTSSPSTSSSDPASSSSTVTSSSSYFYQSEDYQQVYLSGHSLMLLQHHFDNQKSKPSKSPSLSRSNSSKSEVSSASTSPPDVVPFPVPPPSSLLPSLISCPVLSLESVHITPSVLKRLPFLRFGVPPPPLYSDVLFADLDVSSLIGRRTKSHFAKDLSSRSRDRDNKEKKEDALLEQLARRRHPEGRYKSEQISRMPTVDCEDPFWALPASDVESQGKESAVATTTTTAAAAATTFSFAKVTREMGNFPTLGEAMGGGGGGRQAEADGKARSHEQQQRGGGKWGDRAATTTTAAVTVTAAAALAAVAVKDCSRETKATASIVPDVPAGKKGKTKWKPFVYT